MRHAIPSCLIVLGLAALVVSGCGRTTSTTALDYRYELPPRYDASAYATWAYVEVVDGRREAAVPGFRLPGLTALVDDRAADLVLEAAVDAPVLVDVRTTSRIIRTEEADHVDYGARGEVQVPTRLTIYDGIANQPLIEQPGLTAVPVAVEPAYPTTQAAEAALAVAMRDRTEDWIARAIADARAELQDTWGSEFHGGTAVLRMELASTAENEPRIAEAYQHLLVDLDEAGAKRARAVYRSIGYDIRDEDGEPDRYANVAVAYGNACCAFILRDFEGVHEGIRIARTFELGREEPKLQALEAAAVDLADRLGR